MSEYISPKKVVSTQSKTVRTDSRGRVSLGTALEPDRYYLVTRNEYGKVTLTPMKLVPADDGQEADRG